MATLPTNPRSFLLWLAALATGVLLAGLSACTPVGQSAGESSSADSAPRGSSTQASATGGPLRAGLPSGCENNVEFRCARRFSPGEDLQEQMQEKKTTFLWQRQFFKVTPDEPGVLELAIDPMPPGMSAMLTVYDGRQSKVGGGNFTRTDEGQSLFYDFAARAETYYVKIAPSGEPSSYTLRTAFDAEDIYEANDEFSAAKQISFGEPVEAKIKPVDDQDTYEVEVVEAGLVEAALREVPASVSMHMTIYDERQQRVRSQSSGGRERGQRLTRRFEVASPGTYYVRVSGGGSRRSSPGQESDDFYELTVRRAEGE